MAVAMSVSRRLTRQRGDGNAQTPADSGWDHCSDFRSHLATWQSVSSESAISISTRGEAHAQREDQGFYAHSNPGRREGHEHEGKDRAVHGGVARDGALRGDRARAPWGGDH